MVHAHERFSSISGVLYAEDFDEPLLKPEPAHAAGPAPEPEPEPEIVAPSFSLEELRAATEQGIEEGRAIERRAAGLSLEAQRNAALASLAEQLSLAQEQSGKLVEQALEAIARTSLSLLAVALPALCASHAETELRALLQRVLPPARQLAELNVRVHPALRSAIEQETSALLEGSGTQVTWTDSAKLQPGDITIAWQNGSALRDTGAICADVHKAVLALFDPEQEARAPETHDVQ
jgi:flagellar assembly protein FliH